MEAIKFKKAIRKIPKHFIPAFIASILLAAVFFSTMYFYDNKYTWGSPQASEGFLSVGSDTLKSYPVMYLTEGWEIYKQVLLTPDTIENYTPDDYIYIGHYKDMSFGDETCDAHGSATYHLVIDVSADQGDNVYTLQMPEIYSAYNLYINGERMLSMGVPEQDGYKVEVYSTSVTFHAADTIDIIIAASDWTNSSSGLVSAPAFGDSVSINSISQLRLIVRSILIGASLMLGISIILARTMVHRRPSVLFLLLIICIIGMTLPTLIASVTPVGSFWYYFETFCFYAIFFLAIWLCNELCHIHDWFSMLIKIIDAVTAVLSVAIPLLCVSSAEPIHIFHEIATYYKLFLLFYISFCCFKAMLKGSRYAPSILCGMGVFLVVTIFSMVTEYDPIMFFVPLHAGCFVIIYIMGIAMVRDKHRYVRALHKRHPHLFTSHEELHGGHSPHSDTELVPEPEIVSVEVPVAEAPANAGSANDNADENASQESTIS